MKKNPPCVTFRLAGRDSLEQLERPLQNVNWVNEIPFSKGRV